MENENTAGLRCTGVQQLPKRKIVAALDIGTSKVATLVGEAGAGDQVNLIGLGEAASLGLRRGMIVDIERTSRSVAEAVAAAERMSGISISSVVVGISGSHIATVNSRGVVAVANPGREITPEDVARVLHAAQVINLPSERHILHVLPRQYIVDGCDGIIDPTGMAGSRLEVEALIVTAATTWVRNLHSCLHKVGLHVDGLVLSPLASAEVVLEPAERELGTILVDIGGGTTEIAIFDRGGLWFTSVLPMGGDYITSDLAVGLRLPLAEAEQLKKRFIPPASANGQVEAIDVGTGRHRQQVSQDLLASIIEPRLEELFQFVQGEISRSGYPALLPGGVVLTGGVAALNGISELASQFLQLPVRVGYPSGIGGMADMVCHPSYATAVGLLVHGMRMVSDQVAVSKDGGRPRSLRRFWEWILDIFREE